MVSLKVTFTKFAWLGFVYHLQKYKRT